MNIGVIFAGGVGRRMNNEGLPKQFLKIYDVPIIVHTLKVFQECNEIDAIVIAIIKTHLDYMEQLVKEYNLTKVKLIVPGGETGQLSIYNGLKAAQEVSNGEKSIVLVHDGVRPLINTDLLVKNIESVKKFGSAISCVPQKETTILSTDGNIIEKSTDRSRTFIARAPQSCYLEDLLELHEKVLEEGENNIIDSCTLMLRYGKKPHIVECNSDNIKITTPDDYYIAKTILKVKENMQIMGV